MSTLIQNWHDFNIEDPEYIQLFTQPISDTELKEFKTNKRLRKLVLNSFLIILFSYGFILDNKKIVVQLKPINQNIGIYLLHNHPDITQILNFLVKINMEFISAIFFLSICKALKYDRKKIIHKSLPLLIKTQPYLKKFNSTPCKLSGLNYTGNSCYMDSSLMCIFAVSNKTITDNILNKNLDILEENKKFGIQCDIKKRKNIQAALNDITKSIREKKNNITCNNFRKTIKQCPGSQPFYNTQTQDAGEFLTYIFNIFQVDVAETDRKTYGSNDLGANPTWTLVSEQIDNNSSPIIDVVSTTLLKIIDGYDITKFIKQKQDSLLSESNKWTPDKKRKPHISYFRRKEIYKLTSSPIIIFNVTRKYGKPIFDKKGEFINIKSYNIWKKLSAPQTLNLNGNLLHLTGIVVHTGGAHYIANFKCNDTWYWYDDNPGSKYTIKHVGSYENMLKTKPSPLTNGTLFFYTI